MTRRNLLIALMIVTLAGVDTSVAQRASVPKQQDRQPARSGVATPDGYRQERQDIQAGIDEVHGGRIRQAGQG
jgi:hypothetical protein